MYEDKNMFLAGHIIIANFSILLKAYNTDLRNRMINCYAMKQGLLEMSRKCFNTYQT